MTTLDLDALERAAMERLSNFARDAAGGIDILGEVVEAYGPAPEHPQWQRIMVRQMAEDVSSLLSTIRALQERVEGAEKVGDLPALLRLWKTPWYVHPDGIKSADGCWIMSGGNKTMHDIVELANFAARTKAGEPHAEQGGEPADQKYIIDSAGNTGWIIP